MADQGSIGSIDPWVIYEQHKLSFCFMFNMCFHFVKHQVMSIGPRARKTQKFEILVRSKANQYQKELPDSFHRNLASRFNHLPMRVYVFIVGVEEGGCTCDIECFPTLYEKMKRRVLEEEPTEFDFTDAFLSCRRFVKTTFEGGLSARLISEEKVGPQKPRAQLLINDQASRQILGKIEEMLEQATSEVLICGWIGTLLLPKLRKVEEKGVNIRVITHKTIELKGQPGKQDIQRAFGELISMLGKDNISINPECHCRAVVVDNKALIGSMDLNSYSLAGTHRELAVYAEDPEVVRSLRNYLNGIFSPLSQKSLNANIKQDK